MGQILHGSARTTAAVRRAIQHSQESLIALSKRYSIKPKTVAKWKRRTSVTDLPTGPRNAKSTTLSIEEEAIIVAFRRHSLLPLDDCLYALQATIPHLTRSSLHRCLQRSQIYADCVNLPPRDQPVARSDGRQGAEEERSNPRTGGSWGKPRLTRSATSISTLTTSLRSRHRLDCGAEVRTAEGKLHLYVGIDRYPPSSPLRRSSGQASSSS
jgi:transposase-like protein